MALLIPFRQAPQQLCNPLTSTFVSAAASDANDSHEPANSAARIIGFDFMVSSFGVRFLGESARRGH
jgi:hypothetical protein